LGHHDHSGRAPDTADGSGDLGDLGDRRGRVRPRPPGSGRV